MLWSFFALIAVSFCSYLKCIVLNAACRDISEQQCEVKKNNESSGSVRTLSDANVRMRNANPDNYWLTMDNGICLNSRFHFHCITATGFVSGILCFSIRLYVNCI